MSESSCSELEMVDVEITDNECSSEGCGVLLGKRSNLENFTVSGNKVVRSNKQPSSLVYAPSSSTTMIQGLTASENDLAVVRLQDGVLYLSNSSFDRNSLDKKNARKTKISCVHLVKSSAEISKCNFTENEGYNGSAVLAKRSNVYVSGSIFRNNNGSLAGGCIYAENSNVELENTTVTNSSAEYGGFMYARSSNVMLENTVATNNSAKSGGFMSADGLAVKFKDTTTTNSSAEYGGFMYVWWSNVTLENTTANNNSAESEGGFMYVWGSNVTLENTTANNNSADDGGFMYVSWSNVALENATANNSRAEYGGGFVYGISSQLRIALSQFSSSNSNIFGGFAELESSSIFINDSEIVGGRSKNGGAIWMKKSDMKARNLSISHCRADNSGGGVMSRAHSTFLCADCKFENNSAEKGNGGAVFFDSQPNQTLALQIVQSRFENNSAELGGRPRRKKLTAFDVYV